MEDSEEDETKFSIEEDKVMDLCSDTISKYLATISDIVQTCSPNVPIIPLQIRQLKIVGNLLESGKRRMFCHRRTIIRMQMKM